MTLHNIKAIWQMLSANPFWVIPTLSELLNVRSTEDTLFNWCMFAVHWELVVYYCLLYLHSGALWRLKWDKRGHNVFPASNLICTLSPSELEIHITAYPLCGYVRTLILSVTCSSSQEKKSKPDTFSYEKNLEKTRRSWFYAVVLSIRVV